MDIKRLLEREIEEEKAIGIRLKSILGNATDERLIGTKRNGRDELYLVSNGRRKYAGKKEDKIIRRIRVRKICSVIYDLISKNTAVLENTKVQITNINLRYVNNLLPASYRLSDDDMVRLSARVGMTYQSSKVDNIAQSENTSHADHLIYVTQEGLYVRSKNELLIAHCLMELGIPFKYEKSLKLSGYYPGSEIIIYPDFTLNINGKDTYLEHFGMVQAPEYAKKMCDKLVLYHYNGIYPPKNLIITMDGPNGEFDEMKLYNMLSNMILNS